MAKGTTVHVMSEVLSHKLPHYSLLLVLCKLEPKLVHEVQITFLHLVCVLMKVIIVIVALL